MTEADEMDVDSELEPLDSERQDHEASLRTYEILTYPADYTLEVLVDKWRKKQVIIPRFQRRFVWTQVQASKLIESFLLGLPVPAIFLYSDPETNELLVVDGQQRLKTIAYFFEGYFGDEDQGRRSVFRLTGLDERSPYKDFTYRDLEDKDNAAYLKLNDSVLRAFVIKQLDPADDTSIYHIFERLNTGGTFLHPQEIRNCIHQGRFNDLLISLNKDMTWRSIYGSKNPDKRQRDVELILRFFALLNSNETYQKPMKDFLNRYMKANRSPSEDELEDFRRTFSGVVALVSSKLGPKPFRIRAGLNAAVFDSVFVALAQGIREGVNLNDLEERYRALVADESFLREVSSNTTDREVVTSRIGRARDYLLS